ncbi:MAG: hypothetical protein ACREXS_19250 [Gammaproteobacteria bacterium]
MKAKTVVLSTALAGALAAASAVHALDAKVFPGNGCQAAVGSQAADFINRDDAIVNLGGGNRLVVCPILRDNDANLKGVKSVGVRVVNPNGAILNCFLQSFTVLGDLVAFDYNSTTSTVAINLPLDIDISTKGGTYSLQCSLPPDGQILGYRVDEF